MLHKRKEQSTMLCWFFFFFLSNEKYVNFRWKKTYSIDLQYMQQLPLLDTKWNRDKQHFPEQYWNAHGNMKWKPGSEATVYDIYIQYNFQTQDWNLSYLQLHKYLDIHYKVCLHSISVYWLDHQWDSRVYENKQNHPVLKEKLTETHWDK